MSCASEKRKVKVGVAWVGSFPLDMVRDGAV